MSDGTDSRQRDVSRAETPSRTSGITSALAATFAVLVALPLLYVLSVGPVAMCVERFAPNMRRPVQAFYLPLRWLHDATPLREPLNWYVGLFGVR